MRNIDVYKANRVESASKPQIVTMLFQEVGRRLEMAKASLEAGTHDWRGHIHHVREILIELRMALDFDVAPDICKSLASIYDWAGDELIAAGRDRAESRIQNVVRVNDTLLDAWTAALERVNDAAAPAAP